MSIQTFAEPGDGMAPRPRAQERQMLSKEHPILINTQGLVHRGGGASWRALACGLETSTLCACFKVRPARQNQATIRSEDDQMKYPSSAVLQRRSREGRTDIQSRASWQAVPVCRLIGSSWSWLVPIVWSRQKVIPSVEKKACMARSHNRRP